MPSFARRRPPTAAWSVDDASTFAAQKEFKLLQLLSTDKKALSTARRLGLFSKQPQPHKETARSGAAAAATSARRQPDAASGRPVGPNSAQRRSAARSAQHHAQLQLRFYRTAIAVLYFCRLRRRCRLRTNLADLESLKSGSVREGSGALPMFSSAPLGASSSKRADRPPSSASSSVASGASSSSSDALHGGFYRAQRPPMLLGPGEPRKQPRKAPPAPPYAGRM